MTEVTVQAFIDRVSEALALESCAGIAGASRLIRKARVQKPGLALVGHTSSVQRDRIQVLGQTEMSYLTGLAPDVRAHAIQHLLGCEVACILVTKGLALPAELIAGCDRTATPLIRTSLSSSDAIPRVLGYLDDLLMPRTSVHGVLVDVDGVGALMTGASGVGKSECALELILRGHRLVADDVVEIRRRGEDLVGQASGLIKNLIEIRGLGILNVAELYGVAATRDHKRIELHIELEEWRANRPYDRIGLEERRHDILGVPLHSLLVPVKPGRDIAAIVEVAARNFLLRIRGHHAASELKHRIEREMKLAEQLRVQAALADESTDLPNLTSLRTAANLSEGLDHIEDEVE
ncbi:MAG: HPr(Ser) kinase/phosphatase [Deltaproteobacteria bacterium]|nr:HPr(Ser) kinase/phosphatase [Deltaproteobacteria bacterium]